MDSTRRHRRTEITTAFVLTFLGTFLLIGGLAGVREISDGTRAPFPEGVLFIIVGALVTAGVVAGTFYLGLLPREPLGGTGDARVWQTVLVFGLVTDAVVIGQVPLYVTMADRVDPVFRFATTLLPAVCGFVAVVLYRTGVLPLPRVLVGDEWTRRQDRLLFATVVLGAYYYGARMVGHPLDGWNLLIGFSTGAVVLKLRKLGTFDTS